MSRAGQIRFVAHGWDYALSVCIRSSSEGAEREALIVCEERPTLPNIRAVLAIGLSRPWLPLIESALVEIGLVPIEAILKEADHDHRD